MREATKSTMLRFLKPRMSEPEVKADAPDAFEMALPSTVRSASSRGAELPPVAPPALWRFITIQNNYDGHKQTLLAPATEARDDSDQEGEDDHSANTNVDVLAKRNTKYTHKHGVVMRQSTAEGAGYGLFASQPLPIGRLLPLKGPWYQSVPYVAPVAMAVTNKPAGCPTVQRAGATLENQGVVRKQPGARWICNSWGTHPWTTTCGL